MDALHPGQVNLVDFNFGAKNKDEYERNLKLLGDLFHKLNLKRSIDSVSLSRGKF